MQAAAAAERSCPRRIPVGQDPCPRCRALAGIQVTEFTVDIVAEFIFTDSIRWLPGSRQ
jgi:hypothetical protein